MPNTQEYLNGYDIKIGSIYGEYKLLNIECQHIQLVRWNEYKYPCVITFKWIGKESSNYDKAQQMVKNFYYQEFLVKKQ